MGKGPTARRFHFSLGQLFKAVTLCAIVAGWATWNWHRCHERRQFLELSGAVHGHVRTVQGYSTQWDKWSIKYRLFGDQRVLTIDLYPGTYDAEYFRRLSELFPEAVVSSISLDL